MRPHGRKRIVPQAAFISKIRAFVDTRTSEDFLLFARTDAVAVGGFNEAVDRANAYREAGADVIFVEAPTTIDQVERLPKLVDAPLLYNWVFRGKSPLVPRTSSSASGTGSCSRRTSCTRSRMPCADTSPSSRRHRVTGHGNSG